MPFVSQAQARACWAQYNRDKAAGKKPAWDCHEWAAASPAWEDLPAAAKKRKTARSASPRKAKARSKAKTPAKKSVKAKVHIGPKGGRYIIKQGRKVYIKQ